MLHMHVHVHYCRNAERKGVAGLDFPPMDRQEVTERGRLWRGEINKRCFVLFCYPSRK